MDVSTLIWGLTLAVVVLLLAVDFLGHARKVHAPSLREAAWWSLGYVIVALLFGGFVWLQWGQEFGVQYFSGYITEKSLSVDNLFVFVLIFASFKVPREYQQKILLIGIAIALVLRSLFIFVGAAAIARFSSVFYLFGAFLIYTAYTQVRGKQEEEYQENRLLRLTRRILPTTEDYVGDKLTTRMQGRRYITPLLIVVFAIGSADVMFAVDSIPAIFGLTQEPFLVFVANAFSLLGLLQLYFLIDGLLDKLVYLHYGLAAILAFIGAKLVIHALHINTLGVINGGRPWLAIPEPGTFVSLAVIVGILAVTTVASLTIGRRRAEFSRGEAEEPAEEAPGR
ncbi:MAG TPA: TerC/Alx family metal homeostasis membrane protein [Ruania sp.]|nr:TerC/Alx family metal homeostasis membrane protein [Ruania sp.]